VKCFEHDDSYGQLMMAHMKSCNWLGPWRCWMETTVRGVQRNPWVASLQRTEDCCGVIFGEVETLEVFLPRGWGGHVTGTPPLLLLVEPATISNAMIYEWLSLGGKERSSQLCDIILRIQRQSYLSNPYLYAADVPATSLSPPFSSPSPLFHCSLSFR
jgi:hypothetical protein